MAEIVSDYDPAEDLTSPEAISAFVHEVLKSEHDAYIAHALGVVARAKGMAGVAVVAKLSSEGNPTLKTTLAVMKALGDFADGGFRSYPVALPSPHHPIAPATPAG